MKQIKSCLIIALLVVLIIPSVALAAWWNPLSWNIWSIFSHKQTPIVRQQPRQNNGNFLDQIKNYSYDVSLEGLYFSKGMFGPQDKNYNPNSVQLVNGSYKSGPYHNTYVSGCTSDITHLISLAADSNGNPLYASGDLNGDGKQDAVVILNLEYKEENQAGPHDYCKPIEGSSYDYSELMLVVLVSNNGKLEQADSYISRRASLPTASNISNITISNGIIALNGKNVEEYKIVGGKIVISGKPFQAPVIPAGLKTYTDNNFGFSFQYPDNLNFTAQDVQPPALLEMQTGNINAQENVSTVSINTESLASCVSPGQNGGLATELMINGTPFYETAEDDAAMGTYSSMVQYATFKNGECYRIGLLYFTHRCDACSSGQTDAQSISECNICTQNNKSAEDLSTIPDIIVSTFKFIAPSAQSAINIFSPKDGDVVHVGQITEVSWWHYNPKNGDAAIFDISEINSSGQKVIASVVPSQIECNGHGAAACTYKWTPTQAFQQDQISVSERGADKIGYSGTFSVITPALIKPTITNINPTQAGANSIITINGDNLLGAIAVVFYQNGQLRASAPASYILSDNQYQLTFNTDSFRVYSGTYQVEVYTAAGYSNSVNFTIATAN